MRDLQTLKQVFNKKIFRIPDYQRGYAWGEKQYVEFWEDLLTLDEKRKHYTGVISIKSIPEDDWKLLLQDEEWLIQERDYHPFYIVDGQQRITTISILLKCLVDAIKSNPENEGLSNDEIYLLGSYKLSDIIEDYIVITEPEDEIIKTYKFGYAVDNPSFKFLRYNIFDEPNGGNVDETFYTLNLENAKVFFTNNITALIENRGHQGLEVIFKALTQRFMFNFYEIDDNFDVFVAFETMNHRGKKLSDLELLKNRLIYLTTLYPEEEVRADTKADVRKNINAAWGEVYNQLGKNKAKPLNDDEFLRAHWIMYFKYSRNKGNDYIRFLLDEHFSPKSIFEKITIETESLQKFEELKEETVGEEENTPIASQVSKLKIKAIDDYVNSLKAAAKHWYATFFPSSAEEELSLDEQIIMDKINRVRIAYFRPLIMALFLRTKKGDPERLDLLNAIERFIFIAFKLCGAQSNYRSSSYYRLTRTLYTSENVSATLEHIHNELKEDLAWTFEENGSFKTEYFATIINKNFGSNGKGFYAWSDLRYFLFEYEEELKKYRGVAKFDWKNFITHEKDKISIEHIYPQTPKSDYWTKRFKHCTDEQKRYLKGSLGNLLPLSLSVNIKLQNDDFPDKKKIKKDDKGKVIRNGFANGSYSELEVAELGKDDEWTPEKIKERGLTLLEFMGERWQFDMGCDTKKLALLHLTFLDTSPDVSASEETVLEEGPSSR